MPSPNRPSGLPGLIVVLSGQAVSILASTMVEFGLSIWIFERTSSATVLGGMTTAFTVPFLLLTPIAGAMVELDLRTLYLKDLRLIGCTVLDDGVFAALVRRVERGEVHPLVAAVFPLEELVAAQQRFLEKSHVGKIVIDIAATA